MMAQFCVAHMTRELGDVLDGGFQVVPGPSIRDVVMVQFVPDSGEPENCYGFWAQPHHDVLFRVEMTDEDEKLIPFFDQMGPTFTGTPTQIVEVLDRHAKKLRHMFWEKIQG
jgi:hypothetical protein